MKKGLFMPLLIVLILITFTACQKTTTESLTLSDNLMELKSSAFGNQGTIPAKYTCDGENVSPPLNWSDTPEDAKSFTLICDDPDAPAGTWTHWILFNLPATATELPENVPATETLANGAKQGKNDFGKLGYGGPCPPSGTHQYSFRIYALDTELNLESGASKDQVVSAMESYILAQGELVGKYQRQ